MSTYFDNAFLGSPHVLSDDEIFDFEGASSRVSSNNPDDQCSRPEPIEEAEAPDVLSDNDDGLFCDNTSDFDYNPNNQEAGEEEDAGTADDQVYSWKIDHSSGDHKLRRKFV
jgi:hypothetical protein